MDMPAAAAAVPNRTAVSLLALLAMGWAALVLAAPLLAAGAPSRSVSWGTAAVYHAAGQVCHQRVARSFALSGVPFPVCGRCLALYLAGAAGLGAAATRAWRSAHPRVMPGAPPWAPPWVPVRWTPEAAWLAAASAPLLGVVAWEWLVSDPGNVVRAVSSLPLGVASGWVAGRGLARQ